MKSVERLWDKSDERDPTRNALNIKNLINRPISTAYFYAPFIFGFSMLGEDAGFDVVLSRVEVFLCFSCPSDNMNRVVL